VKAADAVLRPRPGDPLAAGVLLLATLGVAAAQLPARELHQRVRETSEAYLLPPPEQLVVASLGHRAALADLLWAKVLVTQGLRLQERRRFETVVPYLDAINQLDPTWRDPYRLAEPLVNLQTVASSMEEVRAVRRILERGVQERPFDAELWMQLGTYTAFIVPSSYLEPDDEEAKRWRIEGAPYLLRAVELGHPDSSIAWQALGAGGIFFRSGQTERAAEFYDRILATTDDPELRERAQTHLMKLATEEQLEAKRARMQAFQELWRERYPGQSITTVLTLGHPRDTAACAGASQAAAADSPRCASSWSEWAERTGRR
jgi:tetratricopeptide (TPR) repeat protein